MKLRNGISITKSKNGEWWSNIEGAWKVYHDAEELSNIVGLYRVFKKKSYDDSLKLEYLTNVKRWFDNKNGIVSDTTNELTAEQNKVKLEETLTKMINFFTEFNFEPNYRFINTLSRQCCYISEEAAKEYVSNYFALTDNTYANAINEKMKSYEFGQILDVLKANAPTKQINKRFKLYYGSQGTGKTTEAMAEAVGNCMICHSAMLPSDLMEDFKFNDGKAAFTPSALFKAMTEGKTIVLDEINLLPFESLRFLQSILDGKTQFEYKGQTINIADGFKIIGTMNLQVNGAVYALPEPLVDRAEALKKFTLTADKLVSAII